MCGICGIINPSGEVVSRGVLTAMRDALIHRGPDAAGLYIDGNIGLGHRRLKIIDLSEAATQPMQNENGSIQVVFNGEIYNFHELRSALEAKGHQFQSQSDTEVIVHGYEEWGQTCVERFNGMFAFAVYDQRRQEIFLARDRLGIKPLYYCVHGKSFLFASEIKAFRGIPGFQSALNECTLGEYLLYRSLAGDQTLLAGVKALLPGHWMRVTQDHSLDIRQYWSISLDSPPVENSPDEKVLALLKDSVHLQEVSDVPIGAQLSGGTDSSLVIALMAERSRLPLTTFSVGFEEKGYSELSYANRVAQQFNTVHHEIVHGNRDFDEILDKMTWHMDEPLTHANSAGIYWLCQRAKQVVTVLLTGEGADETFAGYHRYAWLNKCFIAQRWCKPMIPILRYGRGLHTVRQLEKALTHSPGDLTVKSTAQGYDQFHNFLPPATLRGALQERFNIFETAQHMQLLNRALYYDIKTYLPPILMRQDKMSMAHGLETRVPFLDHRVVELAFRLPLRAKVRGDTGKWILKHVARQYLSDEILYRPKIGFGFPIAHWMRQTDGIGARLDMILDSQSLATRLVPHSTIEQWLTDHRDGKANHSDPLWTLLALEVWNRQLHT
jgi:asparagine synthase (glutamine-hydrolysing)